MRVVICEDESEQRKFFENVIKYARFHYPGVELVLSASKPEEVLNYIKENQVDCYFLDIEYESAIDGLELARNIRKQDPIAPIIFITSYESKLRLTFKYKIAALDFVIKIPDNQKLITQIIDALDTAYNRYIKLGQMEEMNVLQIKVGDYIKNICYEDIYYFETSHTPHKIKVHSKNGIFEFYGRLKDLEKLDKRFCRSHSSYVVNLQYLVEYDLKNKTLKMENGHNCLVSYRYANNIKKNLNLI